MRKIIKSITLLLLTLTLPLSSLAAEDIFNLDLESLMQIKITSAGRKDQNIMTVPAAVYVLDQEDISNSGATSIPEVLRLVPGLVVARNSSNGWAISSRGFNRTFANKLLVQIDGRSVYTPTYSGVYWDMQNVILEDIERIEIIRGPGATLWGANAVNGVINIITKQSSDTQGGMISVASGNHEKLIASTRYGARMGKNTYGRFYLHRQQQDSYQFLADETDANDDWTVFQGGFRFDGNVGIKNSWTVQGDLYRNDMSQELDYFITMEPPYTSSVEDDFKTRGHNILARWEHNKSESSSTTLQLYYDETNRDEIYIEQTNRKIDIDLQQRFQLFDQHDVVWGLGYRFHEDRFGNTFQVQLDPETEKSTLLSGFIQDEISIIKDQLWLTAGIKVENNDDTGTEYQPNLRLLWKPRNKHSIWTSISRAVRTPSKAETDISIVASIVDVPIPPDYTTTIPVELTIKGDKGFASEELVAYEAGYRYAASEKISLDFACFYNSYSGLRTFRFDQDAFTLYFANGNHSAYSYGAELTTKWILTDWLATELNYSYIYMKVSQSIQDDSMERNTSTFDEGLLTPQHQVSSRFHFSPTDQLRINLTLRYVDETEYRGLYNADSSTVKVDAYTEIDANIKWTLNKNLELALVGQNLLDPHHLEAVADTYFAPIEVGRSVYAKLTWEF